MAALSGWLAVSTQPTIGVNAPPTDAGYLRQEIAWDGSPRTNDRSVCPLARKKSTVGLYVMLWSMTVRWQVTHSFSGVLFQTTRPRPLLYRPRLS
jgi:hypothetical protein